MSILLLSFFMNFFNLAIEGYGNAYYAAGVKSMLTSIKNFFFVSYDPSGFVTIDKPPLGFWLQAISAKVFGFSGISIILPQAICGVISVSLIYYFVKKFFGETAGLISALVLSITPIFVAASRNNTIDNVLVLFLILSALFMIKASSSGSSKYLILSFIMLGLGFNVKMSEAYLILPALYITYLLSSKITLRKKIINFALGTLILICVSLSWAFVVDSIPSKDRPFVGSSTNNTVTQLILGHNGLSRVKFSNIFSKNKNTKQNENKTLKFISNSNMGNSSKPSILRLFGNNNLSDQIGWLLPLALFAFASAAIKEKLNFPFDNEKKLMLVLMFIWLAAEFIFFSFTKGGFHSYYLTTMAPPIAALIGIGIVSMWSFYITKDKKAFLLPLSLSFTAIVQIIILHYKHNTNKVYIEIMLLIGFITFTFSVFLMFSNNNKGYRENTKKTFAILTFVGVIIAPLIWSFTPMFRNMSGSSPSAGLELPKNSHPFKNSNNIGLNAEESKLFNFLEHNEKSEKYLFAVPAVDSYSSDLIIKTGKPVMSFGGFGGSDKILSLRSFRKLVKSGGLRYVLLPANNKQLYSSSNSNRSIINWIRENGTVIPNNVWSISNRKKNNKISISFKLYDLKYNKQNEA